MDISKIYSTSWKITKKHKWLWITGLVVLIFSSGSGGGINSGGSYDFGDLESTYKEKDKLKEGKDLLLPYEKSDFDSNSIYNTPKNNFDNDVLGVQSPTSVPYVNVVADFFSKTLEILSKVPTLVWFLLFLSVILLLLYGGFINLVIYSWAVGSLIGGIYSRIDEVEKDLGLSEISSYGKRNIKATMQLLIIPTILSFLILLVIAYTAFVSIFNQFSLGVVFSAVFVIFIIVVFLMVYNLLLLWAVRISTIENKPAKESLILAIRFLKRYLGDTLLLGMANKGVGCLISIAMIILVIPVMLIIMMGAISEAFMAVIIILFVIFIIPIGIVMSVFNAAYKVFNYSTWTVLYKENRETFMQSQIK
jgi:hypothetical protein